VRNRKKKHDKDLEQQKKQAEVERVNKALRSYFVKKGVLPEVPYETTS
jgi:hypothetical protein